MLVCIKQVPDTEEIKIDDATNTPIMDGVPDIVNPYDEYALETANRIKDADPSAKVVVLSMGPEKAEAALKTCLAVGAEQAYLVRDDAFADSDTLATGYILSKAIAAIEEKEGKFDVIFCGQQAIDGDTAQVGPQLAEYLGYPQITSGIEAAVDGDLIKVKREADDGFTVIAAKMPCVIAITQPLYELRYPTIKSKMAAKRANVPVLTATEIGTSAELVGLKGSPTEVKVTFVPPRRKGGIVIDEGSAETDIKKLAELLSAAALI